MTLPRVRIAGEVFVPKALVSDVRASIASLSVPNPKYLQAQRMGSKSLHRIPQTLTLVRNTGDELAYPIGARDVLARELRGKPLEWHDERPTFEPHPRENPFALAPEQRAMVTTMVAAKGGIGVAPCGSGKGELIVDLVAKVGLPTLIVVGQKEHAHDLSSRIDERLGVPVGRIYGGKMKRASVTVATVQSLQRPGTLRMIERKFGMLIVDEVHHAASETYQLVLRSLPVQRRYGFTATRRTDGLWPLVPWQFGPELYAMDQEDLERMGRSVVPDYQVVPTDYWFEWAGPDSWAPLVQDIVKDDARNRLIVDVVAEECSADDMGAVLTGNIEHAELLARMLEGRGLRTNVLSSNVKDWQRKKILADAKEGRLDVLCGTQVLDEGIDIPRLSRVALVFPSKGEGRFVQRVGRALRVFPGKSKPLVLDFLDDRVGVLRRQGKLRAEHFQKTWGLRTLFREAL